MRSWEQIDGVVGAVSLGVDCGFNPAMNQPWFGGELAPIVRRSGLDRTAIVRHDHKSGLIPAVWFDQVGWAVPIARFSSLVQWGSNAPESSTRRHGERRSRSIVVIDEALSCVVKTQKCKSNKIYKTELTKIRYKIK